MLLLVCVLLLGMMLRAPVSKAYYAVTQAVNHFLLISLLLMVGVLILAAAGQ